MFLKTIYTKFVPIFQPLLVETNFFQRSQESSPLCLLTELEARGRAVPPGMIDVPVLLSTLLVRGMYIIAIYKRQLKVNDLLCFSGSSRMPSLTRISSTTSQRFLDQKPYLLANHTRDGRAEGYSS